MRDNKAMLSKFGIKKGFNLISLPTITLEAEEADQFIDYVVDESVMKNFARIVRMSKPQKNIRALGFGSGKFLHTGDHFDETKYKKTWAQNLITLATKKARGAIVVFDDDIEDIAGLQTEAQYVDQLMRIVTKKIAHELEEAFWIADTHGVNAYPDDDIRSLWDGWRYRLTHSQLSTDQYYNKAVPGGARLLNACEGGTSGSPFALAGKIAEQAATAPYNWEFKYHQILKSMPSKYKAQNGLANMVFLNSDLVTQDYLEAMSARSTSLGDAVFKGEFQPTYGRVPIYDVPLMATTLGDPTATPSTDGVLDAGANADVLLIPKNNLIIGIQRDIKIESERKASEEATHVYYSLRMDIAVENVNAAVLCRCVETDN